MSAQRKLTLAPAARAAVLERLPTPIVAEIKEAEKKQETSRRREVIEALLRAKFPQAFSGPPRVPLAVGISAQIVEALPDINRYRLGAFLRWWTARDDYRDALAHREPRVNLDGSAAGTPTEAEQEHAARRLWGPRADEKLARIRGRSGAAVA